MAIPERDQSRTNRRGFRNGTAVMDILEIIIIRSSRLYRALGRVTYNNLVLY